MSTEEQWYAIITVVIAVIFLWRWWGIAYKIDSIKSIRSLLEITKENFY
jgi:hypothetical protein